MPAPSAFWNPLNDLLGTRAAIATLRVLSQHQGLLPASRIAAQSGLSRQSVYSALQSFVDHELIIAEGSPSSLFRLNPEHPFASAMITMFEIERSHALAMFDEIRKWARKATPSPKAIWLFGSVARQTDTTQSDLDLALIGDRSSIRRQAEDLRDMLRDRSTYGRQRPSVITFSNEELRGLRKKNNDMWHHLIREAIPIYGAAPPVDPE